MESKEYHNRRIAEISQRIKILQSYIDNNSELKHIEKGVGGSYIKRRNSRINANKQQRISEFKSELKVLNEKLLIHESSINNL